MVTQKNISLSIELIARDAFCARGEPLPKFFKDWQISANYVEVLFRLLDVLYGKELPEKAVMFVANNSCLVGKSIVEIGFEKADEIRCEFEKLLPQ